ncbi:MAG: PadR family transcriptional regulator [Candidatus Thorarchaeota archaeon]
MSKSSKKAQEEFDRWSKEVKRGAASLAILAVLGKGSTYGYEVVRNLGEQASFLQLEQGTVYPLLRRLLPHYNGGSESSTNDVENMVCVVR